MHQIINIIMTVSMIIVAIVLIPFIFAIFYNLFKRKWKNILILISIPFEHIGDIDFFIIDLNNNRLYIINHKT